MKNYVLCATLDEDCFNTLKNLKKDIDLKHAKVHLVTIVEIQVYNIDLTPFIYPLEAQYPSIESAANSLLKGLQHSLGIEEENVIIKCMFTSNREETIKQYLESVNADLVVTASRGKHGVAGLFSSSFTDHLIKFAPCDVLAMRPRK